MEKIVTEGVRPAVNHKSKKGTLLQILKKVVTKNCLHLTLNVIQGCHHACWQKTFDYNQVNINDYYSLLFLLNTI